jgi:DNA-binding CsgD family transcriptional regulator/PAS domain-containing protein
VPPQISATHERLSELIGSIYDCVLDPAKWEGTLAAIGAEFLFANAVLSVLRLDNGQMILGASMGIGPAWLARAMEMSPDVMEGWGGPERIQQFPLDEPIVWSEAVGLEAQRASRYFREWGEPQGFLDTAAIGIARDATMVGTVAFGRHGSIGRIGVAELDGLRLLAPHFRRAVTISNFFDMKAIEAESLGAALDALTSAIVLVDENLVIVHANAAARSMLAARDPIRSDKGAIVLPLAASHDSLARAVRDAARDEIALGAKGIGIPVPRTGGNSLVVHVLPLGHGEMRRELGPRASAALFIAPAGASLRMPGEAMALLYDLTPAEARVYELVVAGRALADVAATLGIAPSTVKTHLLRLFDKTGCRRQVDLVRLAAQMARPA